MSKNTLSIIIPTYTGQDTIATTIDSILSQKTDLQIELIIVIDGPNKAIESIIDAYRKLISKSGIDLKIKQLAKNQGRFSARFIGAKLAKHNNLIFIDDRVSFEDDFFASITKLQKEIVIPSVLEARDGSTSISLAMEAIRGIVYKKESDDNQGFYITNQNFDKSAKGTTAIYIQKNVFIDACNVLQRQPKKGLDKEHVSDDTKLLRIIVDNGHNLYKSNNIKIYYHPRSSLWSEIKHTYNRGPKFVDYYLKPGTRYFIPLIGLYLLLIDLLVSAAMLKFNFVDSVLIGIVVILLIFAAILSRNNYKNMVSIYSGLLLLTVFFTAGLAKGLLLKVGTILGPKQP